jgi:hypothetical protein
LQLEQERSIATLHILILRRTNEDTDAPHPLSLLRSRRQRPRSRIANERDQLAPLHGCLKSSTSTLPHRGSENRLVHYAKLIGRCLNRVKTGKAQTEHIESALPPQELT